MDDRKLVFVNTVELAKGLAQTLGQRYEIVVHDFREVDSSIIFIANDHVTNRKVGDPSTDLVLRYLNNNKDPQKDLLLNYSTTTKNGKKLRSTTLFLRDRQKKVIGALCINIDLTDYLFARNVLNELLYGAEMEDQEKSVEEYFSNNVRELFDTTIQQAIEKTGVPVPMMNKENKIKIVKTMDESGIFLLKNGVELVAQELGVTKYTIYNYLEELRIQNMKGRL